jgi:hypothetical protein
MPSTTTLLLSLSSLLAVGTANQIRFYSRNGCDLNDPFRGCDNIGPNTCCKATTLVYATSISKSPIDIAMAFSSDDDEGCGYVTCSDGREGILCCYTARGQLPAYTGAAFYTINKKRSGAAIATEQQKCTGTMEPNFFGIGEFQIKQAEIVARGESSETFTELMEAFDAVPDEEKVEWLQQHGAVAKSERQMEITQFVEGVSTP